MVDDRWCSKEDGQRYTDYGGGRLQRVQEETVTQLFLLFFILFIYTLNLKVSRRPLI